MKFSLIILWYVVLFSSCVLAQGENSHQVLLQGHLFFENDTLKWENYPNTFPHAVDYITKRDLIYTCNNGGLFTPIGQRLLNLDGRTVANGPEFSNLSVDPHGYTAIHRVSPNASEYLLFYTAYVIGAPNSSLYMARIDLAYDNGRGIILSKDSLIHANSALGLMTIRHNNRRDNWLLSYDIVTQNVITYLINGPNVILHYTHHRPFTFSNVYSSNNNWLNMFSTSSGHLVGLNAFGTDTLFIYRFNASTGQFYDELKYNYNHLTYLQLPQFYVLDGLFSSNGNKIYLKLRQANSGTLPNYTSQNGLFQLDISSWDTAQIRASEISITPRINAGTYGSMFIGPDRNLYVYRTSWPHLPGDHHIARIINPDSTFQQSYLEDSLLAIPNQGSHGESFKNVSNHYNHPERFSIVAERFCVNDTTFFEPFEFENLQSINWDFGDPTSATNTANSIYATHIYTNPGIYTVTAIANYCNRLDTLTKTITILGVPASSGINDTAFCIGGALNLQMNDTLRQTYRWYDNDTSRYKTITQGGWHWLETSNVCFTRRDSFYVEVHEPPVHGLPSDTIFCAGDVITLSPAAGNYTWVWNDGDTLPKNISTPGSYLLIMDNSCGSFPFAIQVAEREPPIPATPADTVICEGRVLRVELPDLLNTSYQWQDGTSDRIRLLSDTGWYEVTATNECGSNSRGFQLSTDDCSCNIYIPNAFSPNGDGLNDQFELQSRCRISQYELVIYNRWGQQLFKSSDITQSWDGNYQGELLPVGEYVYHLYYYREGLGPRQTKGSFRLLR